MMELFLEFASTVVLTLLLCHIIGKLVSSSPNFGSKLGDGEIGVVQDCDFVVQPRIADSGSEKRCQIVEDVEEEEEVEVESEEALEVDEIRCTEEKLVELGEEVREFVDESLRSLETRDVSESFDRSGEKLVEQESRGENGSFPEREHDVIDESPERDNAREIEECFGDAEAKPSVAKREAEIEVTECEEEDDDWVGIERTELEKLFGSAMAFVGSASNEARVSVLDNDVKTKLYGLGMIATQGPCLEPQPMALKVSARAKWNAWQQLGETTPETAMEQYVSLLSESIPGWMQDDLKGCDIKRVLVEAGDERKLEGLKIHH